jgi:hypothetical protein
VIERREQRLNTEAALIQDEYGAASRAVGGTVQHACANCFNLVQMINQQPLPTSKYHSFEACVRPGGGMAGCNVDDARDRQRQIDSDLIAEKIRQQGSAMNGR